MKACLFAAALAAGLGIAACALPPKPTLPKVHVSHAATVFLEMGHESTCSGTIIGPHAVLTATHCLSNPRLPLRVGYVEVRVITRIDDHADHTIVFVDQTYSSWAEHGGEPVAGEAVTMYGNPGPHRDWTRCGAVIGHESDDGKDITLFDLNAFFGDSGSGIFDKDGLLIGVLDVVSLDMVGGVELKAAGSYPLAFTAQEWAGAAL